MADYNSHSYNIPAPSPSQSLQFEFLDLDDASLTVAERVSLSSIVQPSTVPLPGAGGVWKTPRNNSPELEFGDGIAAVFKSLSVASPAPAKTPIATTICHGVPSGNSASYVPSIPIPLPSVATNGPPGSSQATIHINNFTANLNYHGLSSQPNSYDNQDPSLNAYHAGAPPPPQSIPFSHPYQQQYIAPFPPPGQNHMNHTTVYGDAIQSAPSPYHQNVMFLTMPPPPPTNNVGYRAPHIVQQRPREEIQSAPVLPNGGITFGSTPVVSIKNSKRLSETEEMNGDDYAKVTSNDGATKTGNNVVVSSKPTVKNIESSTKQTFVDKSSSSLCEKSSTPTVKQPILSKQNQLNGSQLEPPKTINSSSVKSEFKDASPAKVDSKAESEPSSTTKSDIHEVEGHGNVETSISSPPAVAPVGSWASLFSSKGSNTVSENVSKPTARIPPFSSSEKGELPESKGTTSIEKELGEHLISYNLKHVATALLPRGLTNRSNWCFVNAILQALLACPPFYNLMKNLPKSVIDLKTLKSRTPMLDCIAEFVNEFSVLEQMNKNQKKG